MEYPVIISRKGFSYTSSFPNFQLVSLYDEHQNISTDELISRTRAKILDLIKGGDVTKFSIAQYPQGYPDDKLIVWIHVDENSIPTIRKNLTIPKYLADLAEDEGINLSKLLANTLRKKLL